MLRRARRLPQDDGAPNKKRLSIWRQTKGSEQTILSEAVSIIIVVKSNCVHKILKIKPCK
jgi:hypothetical protein